MSDSTGRASELLPSSVAATCERSTGSRRFGVLVAVMVPLLARLAVFPVEPIPVPWVHDEFGYLLAAKTFASGRLTNPTPPMWEHFETFNVLMKPTYMSKYPPGQGALLAAGILLFGDPWWAVFLSVGVMCGALTWMLQAWFNPPWALLGGVLAGLQFGPAHNWMNSYWGGSLAGIGGCLVLGAYGHLRNRQLAGASPNSDSRVALLLPFVLGTGLSILACTRPYEGLFLAAPVAVALLIRRAWRNAAQVAALVLCGAAPGLVFLLAESRAVTGEWFTAPHEVYRRRWNPRPPSHFSARQTRRRQSTGMRISQNVRRVGTQLRRHQGTGVPSAGCCRAFWSVAEWWAVLSFRERPICRSLRFRCSRPSHDGCAFSASALFACWPGVHCRVG